MPQKRIVLDRLMLEEMYSHAISTYPEECCGLMLGEFEQDGSVKRVIELQRMNNVFASAERYHRYSIDPREYLRAEEEAYEKGEEIVGVYHSHPNAPSKPSTFDRDRAWPSLSYVVVEVENRVAKSVRSWLLAEDRKDFIQEEIKVLEPSQSRKMAPQ
jgi:proteasome lid subunit RPN8/RPN11